MSEQDEIKRRAADARAAAVDHGGERVPFIELTADQAAGRAAELKAAGEWGPLQRTIPVRMAWTELAALMRDRGLASIGELADEELVKWAERTWAIPPAGGLI